MNFDNRDRGVLFGVKERRSDKAPDFEGHIEFGKDLLKKMVDLAKGDKPIKIRVVAWKRKTKNDATFLSLAVSEDKPFEGKRAASPPPKNELDDEIPF